MTHITVSRREDIAPTIARTGFALWPKRISQETAALMEGAVLSFVGTAGKNGAVQFSQVGPQLLEQVWTQEGMGADFAGVLGKGAKISSRNWETCALIAAGFYRGTTWHQEYDTVPQEDCLFAYGNLSDGAGVDRPGLGLVLHPFTETLDELLRDRDAEDGAKADYLANAGYPIIYPEMGQGDVLYFNRFSVHRTYRAGAGIRAAFKLTVVG